MKKNNRFAAQLPDDNHRKFIKYLKGKTVTIKKTLLDDQDRPKVFTLTEKIIDLRVRKGSSQIMDISYSLLTDNVEDSGFDYNVPNYLLKCYIISVQKYFSINKPYMMYFKRIIN